MSLSGSFNLSSLARPAPPPPKRRSRPAPFSLRLTAAERARLMDEARDAPLGSYIKAKLLGDAPPPSLHRARSRIAIADRQALAQALALLGRSRIASNLNQLAHAANIGLLPLDPETIGDLNGATSEVRELRRLIMAALGLKPEAR